MSSVQKRNRPEEPGADPGFGRYAFIFFKRVVVCFGAVAGCVWAIFQLLEWFNVSLNYIKQLGAWGLYAYLASIAILSLLTAAVWTLADAAGALKALAKELQNDHSHSETSFSNELLNSVQKLFDEKKYPDVVRLGEVLSRPLWVSGHYRDRVALGQFLEEAASFAGMAEQQVLALVDDTGWTNAVLGNIAIAKKNIRRGIEIAQKHHFAFFEAKALRHLGTIAHRYDRNLREALQFYTSAQAVLPRIADQRERQEMTAGILFNIAEVKVDQGDFEDSLGSLTQSETIYKELDDCERLVKVHGLCARIYLKQGALSDAKDSFRKALAESRTMGRRDEEARCLLGLAEAHKQDENPELARKEVAEAVSILEELGAKPDLKFARELLKSLS